MSILINWFILSVVILIASYLLSGVSISGFWAAVGTALVLGIVNALIRPLLLILTLPINVLTLGLFTFVINALLVMLVAKIVPGFEIGGFWVALIFSIVVSFFVYIFSLIFK